VNEKNTHCPVCLLAAFVLGICRPPLRLVFHTKWSNRILPANSRPARVFLHSLRGRLIQYSPLLQAGGCS